MKILCCLVYAGSTEVQDSSFMRSDVPDQAILGDDQNATLPPQTAPLTDMLERFAGYENTNFG